MKITKSIKKIINITSIVLVTLTSAGIFYLLFLKKEEDVRWYDGNWSYRRAIYLEIPQESRGMEEEDILIEIDTAKLISGNKLSMDCRDIRFVDEDNSIALKYWIEGGCNTTQTQIWVQIKTPESSDRIIYFYYGNELATKNEEQWTGEFISINIDDCENNWSNRDEFKGRFPLAGVEYNIKGGSELHTHQLFEFPGTSCENPISVASQDNDNLCDTNKNNILNSITTATSNIPKYENVNFCGSNNGYLTQSSIILTDENTPEGWNHISSLDEKFPRGKDGREPEGATSHLHYAKCTNTNIDDMEDDPQEYLNLDSSSGTIAIQTEPPFYTMNFISNPDGGAISKNGIMMVTSIPPLGWEIYKEINGKFLKGTDQNFTEEGNNSDSHSHIPNMNISIKRTTANNLSNIDTEQVCLKVNTYYDYLEKNEETSEESILPPYITILFAKKKSKLVGNVTIELGEEEIGQVLGIDLNPPQPASLLTEDQTDSTTTPMDTLGDRATNPNTPTDLLTDGKTDPIWISTRTPTVSAIYSDPEEDNSASYEIEVNSLENFTGTVMWDTDKQATTITSGQRSSDFTYAGTTLLDDGTTYYIRIRFWDTGDNVSDWGVGTFQDTLRHFQMGGITLEGITIN